MHEEKNTATNYMNDQLELLITEDDEGSYSVTWYGLVGYSMVKMYCASAENARKLFGALQSVIGTEED